MSYILDALKRADAERGRGTVPGLHAQPMPGTAPPENGMYAGRRGWLAGAIILVLAGVVAGAWVWRMPAQGDGSPVRAVVVPVEAPALSQPPVATAPAAGPAPALVTPQAAPVVPAAPVAPRARVEPVAPATDAIAQKPAANVAPPSAPRTEPVPSTPERGASAATPAARPASSASAVKVAPAIAPLLSELPEEIRRLIPALAITGAVYSENPAQRLLLVNGQVLPQGAPAAPEVTIEEIRARSATFTFRGSRFRITY